MTDYAALYHDRFGLAPDGDPGVLPEALLRQIGRRSVRQFKSDPVPTPLLDAVLAAAQSAPSKSDLQQYSIIVIDDQGQRAALMDLVPTQSWAHSAPVFMVFCGDVRRGRRVCETKGLTHGNDNLDTFMNAAVDAGISLASLVLAAEAAGLGCCPVSVLRNRIDEVTKLLELPPGVFPVAGIALGWPASEPAMSLRLPPQLVVHRNRYDDSHLEAELGGYDERRHAVQPIPEAKQRHPDRYGVAEICHWSDNVARQLSLPERPGFAAFLKRHGLSLK